MARCACNQSMCEAGDKGTGEVHSRPKLLGKNDSSLDYMRSFSQRNKWTTMTESDEGLFLHHLMAENITVLRERA